METKNILVNLGGVILCVYCLTLTPKEVCQWCKKAGLNPTEAFCVNQDELQFYCIDERYWADSPDIEKAVRRIIQRQEL